MANDPVIWLEGPYHQLPDSCNISKMSPEKVVDIRFSVPYFIYDGENNSVAFDATTPEEDVVKFIGTIVQLNNILKM
jgi:hypothetical protein